jgi:hypothetical protein
MTQEQQLIARWIAENSKPRQIELPLPAAALRPVAANIGVADQRMGNRRAPLCS